MGVRYQNIEKLKTEEGRPYYRNAIYPEIPISEDDIYIITTGGDRYDTLAQQFYGDSTLWWVIASANTSKTDSLVTKPGVQLRIPNDPQSAVNLFNTVNENR